MNEIISTYLLNEPENLQPMERDDFYREQVEVYKKTKKPTRAIAIVNIFIFNSDGKLFIQKRSDSKNHNAGLLDKSVGGHILFGDSPNYTVMVETVQELQTPSIILENQKDFLKAHKLLENYLHTIAMGQFIDTKVVNFIKIIKDEKIVIANKYYLYFAVYDGAMKTVDREAKGILQYTLFELKKEMEKFPENFTYDLHFYIKKYKKELNDFVKIITKPTDWK